MRILLLSHAFNSLTQRLWIELQQAGHLLSLELDINDAVTAEAVALFGPDLIIAPFLKRAIPRHIWSRHTCLIPHPGIVGDRGPSALDWALLEGRQRWGVTCLQADAEMDAGDIWAYEEFEMPVAATKGAIYRGPVADAAARAVLRAVARVAEGTWKPRPLRQLPPSEVGRQRPAMRQADRAIDWRHDSRERIVRAIRASDGQPGVRAKLLGWPLYVYDAHPERVLSGPPGDIIARRHGAICVATRDGAVWIGHVRHKPADEATLKLPATLALAPRLADVPESVCGIDPAGGDTYQEIVYREQNEVGYLSFDFYNGAMSSDQCQRLLQAYQYARQRPVKVIVLLGGADFWSNGMNLNVIEAAESPADESWRNINAIDDVAHAIITTDDRLTLAVLRGNAGAGGVFLALAADTVLARDGVILNPHYKNMGNLYGSEYWTYLLPRRIGAEGAASLMSQRLPISAGQACKLGLIDAVIDARQGGVLTAVREKAEQLASSGDYQRRLQGKKRLRRHDEACRPLDSYRAGELERMRLNFHGFDPSYHVARYNFVFHVPHSRTPLHLAKHRSPAHPDATGSSGNLHARM